MTWDTNTVKNIAEYMLKNRDVYDLASEAYDENQDVLMERGDQIIQRLLEDGVIPVGSYYRDALEYLQEAYELITPVDQSISYEKGMALLKKIYEQL